MGFRLAVLAFLLSACTGSITAPVVDPDGGPNDPDGGGPGAPDASPVDPTEVEAVCNRWNSDRVDLSEGAWTGDVATCNAGTYEAPGPTNTLKLINLYRWLSGLPATSIDAGQSAQAQECALMMRANGMLSHNPPATWDCYTAAGATGASRSNISTAPSVRSVDAYMADNFAPTSLGHRRWILSGGLSSVGVGSTNAHSCLYVINGFGGGGGGWTAFPGPGVFPHEAVAPFIYSIDEAGWSIQSDSINLGGAVVTITADGIEVPVVVNQLGSGFGSCYAIAMVPQGWETQADTTYHVSVTGIATAIDYDVHVVDCDAL